MQLWKKSFQKNKTKIYFSEQIDLWNELTVQSVHYQYNNFRKILLLLLLLWRGRKSFATNMVPRLTFPLKRLLVVLLKFSSDLDVWWNARDSYMLARRAHIPEKESVQVEDGGECGEEEHSSISRSLDGWLQKVLLWTFFVSTGESQRLVFSSGISDIIVSYIYFTFIIPKSKIYTQTHKYSKVFSRIIQVQYFHHLAYLFTYRHPGDRNTWDPTFSYHLQLLLVVQVNSGLILWLHFSFSNQQKLILESGYMPL